MPYVRRTTRVTSSASARMLSHSVGRAHSPRRPASFEPARAGGPLRRRTTASSRDESVSQRRVEGLGQLLVTVPPSLPERTDTVAGQLGRAVDTTADRRQQPVTDQLHGVGRPGLLAESGDQPWTLTAEDESPQRGQPFPIIHEGRPLALVTRTSSAREAAQEPGHADRGALQLSWIDALVRRVDPAGRLLHPDEQDLGVRV